MARAVMPKNNLVDSIQPRPLNSILLCTFLLLFIGLLMMTSASVEIANSQYSDPFFFLKRQLIFAVVGVFVLAITLQIPIATWRAQSWNLLMGSFLLLLLVLVPGVGESVKGSTRRIDLVVFDLQPSELAKVFIVVYLAAFMERQLDEVIEKWSGFYKPLLVVGAAVALLHFQPDHGTMVILTLTALCMIFLAGAKLHRILLMLALCLGGIALLAIMKPYVIDRINSFLDPWAVENVTNGGYQQAMAQVAFGRGEWFGVGLGNSIQKLYFLPEAHNDFVLAIIGEEWGLIGVATVILLFSVLLYKVFAIGQKAQQENRLFAAFFAYGLGLLFAGQTMINVGASISLLPVKGLTLPFLSYGGASLIMSFFMIGLLVRIQYETDNNIGDKGGV
ncbi:MAG: putative lipid II flippase FtsW [Gammaproteobacteria bacterium]|nr:putative lipid II flippase FtsW [Gammaproteobacteria bacterium]MDG2339068.1 putative lipid II flippase FtsW [Gammaproteobacteria bacterium]